MSGQSTGSRIPAHDVEFSTNEVTEGTRASVSTRRTASAKSLAKELIQNLVDHAKAKFSKPRAELGLQGLSPKDVFTAQKALALGDVSASIHLMAAHKVFHARAQEAVQAVISQLAIKPDKRTVRKHKVEVDIYELNGLTVVVADMKQPHGAQGFKALGNEFRHLGAFALASIPTPNVHVPMSVIIEFWGFRCLVLGFQLYVSRTLYGFDPEIVNIVADEHWVNSSMKHIGHTLNLKERRAGKGFGSTQHLSGDVQIFESEEFGLGTAVFARNLQHLFPCEPKSEEESSAHYKRLRPELVYISKHKLDPDARPSATLFARPSDEDADRGDGNFVTEAETFFHGARAENNPFHPDFDRSTADAEAAKSWPHIVSLSEWNKSQGISNAASVLIEDFLGRRASEAEASLVSSFDWAGNGSSVWKDCTGVKAAGGLQCVQESLAKTRDVIDECAAGATALTRDVVSSASRAAAVDLESVANSGGGSLTQMMMALHAKASASEKIMDTGAAGYMQKNGRQKDPRRRFQVASMLVGALATGFKDSKSKDDDKRQPTHSSRCVDLSSLKRNASRCCACAIIYSKASIELGIGAGLISSGNGKGGLGYGAEPKINFSQLENLGCVASAQQVSSVARTLLSVRTGPLGDFCGSLGLVSDSMHESGSYDWVAGILDGQRGGTSALLDARAIAGFKDNQDISSKKLELFDLTNTAEDELNEIDDKNSDLGFSSQSQTQFQAPSNAKYVSGILYQKPVPDTVLPEHLPNLVFGLEDCQSTVSLLHAHGINMRMLGRVFSRVASAVGPVAVHQLTRSEAGMIDDPQFSRSTLIHKEKEDGEEQTRGVRFSDDVEDARSTAHVGASKDHIKEQVRHNLALPGPIQSSLCSIHTILFHSGGRSNVLRAAGMTPAQDDVNQQSGALSGSPNRKLQSKIPPPPDIAGGFACDHQPNIATVVVFESARLEVMKCILNEMVFRILKSELRRRMRIYVGRDFIRQGNMGYVKYSQAWSKKEAVDMVNLFLGERGAAPQTAAGRKMQAQVQIGKDSELDSVLRKEEFKTALNAISQASDAVVQGSPARGSKLLSDADPSPGSKDELDNSKRLGVKDAVEVGGLESRIHDTDPFKKQSLDPTEESKFSFEKQPYSRGRLEREAKQGVCSALNSSLGQGKGWQSFWRGTVAMKLITMFGISADTILAEIDHAVQRRSNLINSSNEHSKPWYSKLEREHRFSDAAVHLRDFIDDDLILDRLQDACGVQVNPTGRSALRTGATWPPALQEHHIEIRPVVSKSDFYRYVKSTSLVAASQEVNNPEQSRVFTDLLKSSRLALCAWSRVRDPSDDQDAGILVQNWAEIKESLARHAAQFSAALVSRHPRLPSVLSLHASVLGSASSVATGRTKFKLCCDGSSLSRMAARITESSGVKPSMCADRTLALSALVPVYVQGAASEKDFGGNFRKYWLPEEAAAFHCLKSSKQKVTADGIVTIDSAQSGDSLEADLKSMFIRLPGEMSSDAKQVLKSGTVKIPKAAIPFMADWINAFRNGAVGGLALCHAVGQFSRRSPPSSLAPSWICTESFAAAAYPAVFSYSFSEISRDFSTVLSTSAESLVTHSHPSMFAIEIGLRIASRASTCAGVHHRDQFYAAAGKLLSGAIKTLKSQPMFDDIVQQMTALLATNVNIDNRRRMVDHFVLESFPYLPLSNEGQLRRRRIFRRRKLKKAATSSTSQPSKEDVDDKDRWMDWVNSIQAAHKVKRRNVVGIATEAIDALRWLAWGLDPAAGLDDADIATICGAVFRTWGSSSLCFGAIPVWCNRAEPISETMIPKKLRPQVEDIKSTLQSRMRHLSVPGLQCQTPRQESEQLLEYTGEMSDYYHALVESTTKRAGQVPCMTLGPITDPDGNETEDVKELKAMSDWPSMPSIIDPRVGVYLDERVVCWMSLPPAVETTNMGSITPQYLDRLKAYGGQACFETWLPINDVWDAASNNAVRYCLLQRGRAGHMVDCLSLICCRNLSDEILKEVSGIFEMHIQAAITTNLPQFDTEEDEQKDGEFDGDEAMTHVTEEETLRSAMKKSWAESTANLKAAKDRLSIKAKKWLRSPPPIFAKSAAVPLRVVRGLQAAIRVAAGRTGPDAFRRAALAFAKSSAQSKVAPSISRSMWAMLAQNRSSASEVWAALAKEDAGGVLLTDITICYCPGISGEAVEGFVHKLQQLWDSVHSKISTLLDTEQLLLEAERNRSKGLRQLLKGSSNDDQSTIQAKDLQKKKKKKRHGKQKEDEEIAEKLRMSYKSTFRKMRAEISPVHLGSGSLSGALRSLRLNGIQGFTDEICGRTLHGLTTLTSLDLAGNAMIGDSACRAISIFCTSLVSLRLSGCTGVGEASMTSVVNHCAFIKHLDMAAMRCVDDELLHQLCLRTHRVYSKTWAKHIDAADEETMKREHTSIAKMLQKRLQEKANKAKKSAKEQHSVSAAMGTGFDFEGGDLLSPLFSPVSEAADLNGMFDQPLAAKDEQQAAALAEANGKGSRPQTVHFAKSPKSKRKEDKEELNKKKDREASKKYRPFYAMPNEDMELCKVVIRVSDIIMEDWLYKSKEPRKCRLRFSLPGGEISSTREFLPSKEMRLLVPLGEDMILPDVNHGMKIKVELLERQESSKQAIIAWTQMDLPKFVDKPADDFELIKLRVADRDEMMEAELGSLYSRAAGNSQNKHGMPTLEEELALKAQMRSNADAMKSILEEEMKQEMQGKKRKVAKMYLTSQILSANKFDDYVKQMKQAKKGKSGGSFKILRRRPNPNKISETVMEIVTENVVDWLMDSIDIYEPCKLLKTLNLQNCSNISDNGVVDVLRTFKGFESLNLRGCSDVSDVTLLAIGEFHTQLRSLDVSECPAISDGSVLMIGETCTKLESLCISECGVGDSSLGSTVNSNYNSLTKLELLGLANVTDVTASVASQCKFLYSVSFAGCPKISDSAVALLGHGCSLLRHVDLHWCSNLSDSGIELLARHCRGLLSLDISNCQNLSDSSLIVVSECCKSLNSLLASGLEKVTDQGIRILAENSDSLVNLSLSMCVGISDFAMSRIAIHCRPLCFLDIVGCPMVTMKGVRQLAIALPACHVSHNSDRGIPSADVMRLHSSGGDSTVQASSQINQEGRRDINANTSEPSIRRTHIQHSLLKSDKIRSTLRTKSVQQPFRNYAPKQSGLEEDL